MKLFAVIQADGKFTAGLITGTMVFDSDSVMLEDIIFTSYAEIFKKSQVKEINDFIPLVEWTNSSLIDIIGSPLPYAQTTNTIDLPYDPEVITEEIIDRIANDYRPVENIWVNKKSVLVDK